MRSEAHTRLEAYKASLRQEEFEKTIAPVRALLEKIALPEVEEVRSNVQYRLVYESLLRDCFETPSNRGTLRIDLTGDRLREAHRLLLRAFSECTDRYSLAPGDGLHPHWKKSVFHPRAVMGIILKYGLDGEGPRTIRQVTEEMGLNPDTMATNIGAIVNTNIWVIARRLGQQFFDGSIVSFTADTTENSPRRGIDPTTSSGQTIL